MKTERIVAVLGLAVAMAVCPYIAQGVDDPDRFRGGRVASHAECR